MEVAAPDASPGAPRVNLPSSPEPFGLLFYAHSHTLRHFGGLFSINIGFSQLPASAWFPEYHTLVCEFWE